jgi:hypothetical protein
MATPLFGSSGVAAAGTPARAASRSDAATRLGVLDIGSNSAQLQIVDLRHGAPPLPAYAVNSQFVSVRT